jgi:hypothetical protein
VDSHKRIFWRLIAVTGRKKSGSLNVWIVVRTSTGGADKIDSQQFKKLQKLSRFLKVNTAP